MERADMKKRSHSRGTRLATFQTDMVPLPRDEGEPMPPVAVDMLPDATHAVYYITSPWMELLYVGQSTNLILRLRQHAAKDWFNPDCRIFAEWFRDGASAKLRESHAIANARPLHNRMVPTVPDGDPPEPDLPMRHVRDLERDIPTLCQNCGVRWKATVGRCQACAAYLYRNGCERPRHLYERL